LLNRFLIIIITIIIGYVTPLNYFIVLIILIACLIATNPYEITPQEIRGRSTPYDFHRSRH